MNKSSLLDLNATSFRRATSYTGTMLLAGIILLIGTIIIGSSKVAAYDLNLNKPLAPVESQTYQVQVNDKTRAAQLLVSYHDALVEKSNDGRSLTLSLTQKEVAELSALGYQLVPHSIIASKQFQKTKAFVAENQKLNQAKVNSFVGIPEFSCYATVEETYQEAAGFAAQYPSLTEWKKIGESWDKENGNGGYDLNVLVITNDNGKANKPKLFIHSAMHAREYTTAALTLEFARELVEGFGENADINWILNEHEVHILFVMNPDGRKHAETGLLWRKNTNQNYCGATSETRGVDLNRNFTYFWNTTVNGSSGEQCEQTYRGPSPASEPETQAVEAYVKSLFPDVRGDMESDAAPSDTAGLHLDIHSAGGMILWPWGHTTAPAPNGDALATLGRKVAAFNRYNPFQSVGLYPTDGTSDDVSYGELGIAHLTFELGTSFFQDCESYQQDILPNNLQALLYAAKTVEMPYQKPAGPDVLDLRLVGAGTQAVPPGTTVTLTGTANDQFFHYQASDTNFEASQNIEQVEYAIGGYAWDNPADINQLTPVDGLLNSAEESVNAVIDTSALADGSYNIYARAKDSDDNWGVMSAARLIIDSGSSGQNSAPIATFSASCNKGICQLDASASSDDNGIDKYLWRINERAPLHGQQVFFEYSDTDDYDIRLEVLDLHHVENVITQTHSLVGNSLPIIEVTRSCDQLRCTFDGSASRDSDGVITAHVWQVGDEYFEGPTLTYQFTQAGAKTLYLFVRDDWGASGQWNRETIQFTLVNSDDDSGDEPTSSGGGGAGVGFAVIGLLFLRRKKVSSQVVQ